MIHIRTSTSMSPFRRRTLTVTSCSCRTNRRSTLAPPTERFIILARLRNGGKKGRTIETLDSSALILRPRHACNIRNTAAADQACGAQATGYKIGPWPSSRGNPQNSSGRQETAPFPGGQRSVIPGACVFVLGADSIFAGWSAWNHQTPPSGRSGHSARSARRTAR